ncbi:MAG: S46 family peptidase, partial [Bacteroidales bacterium]
LESINKALEESPETLYKDPALQTGNSIFSLMPKLMQEVSEANETYAQGHKAYIAGQLEMKKDAAIYPDANSTMRMTYGQVLDYSPRDAVHYDFVTTLEGVMEKEDPKNWEFVVPAKLKELYTNKDYGQYAMTNGKMPVCFISNNDITGGNSGSPVLNAKGELIGTAFDGNWEAMSGDIIFEPNVQRCINVDVRYILFIIEKYGNAKHLIDEMTIVK